MIKMSISTKRLEFIMTEDEELQKELEELEKIAAEEGLTIAEYMKREAAKLAEK